LWKLSRFDRAGQSRVGLYGLLELARAALPLAEHAECIAEIILGHGPVERHARAGSFLQGVAKGGDGLVEPRRPALPLAEFPERIAEIILGPGPLERHAFAGSFAQNLAIKLDAFGQRFILSRLLAVLSERSGQAELDPCQGFWFPDAFPALNQRADLRDQGRESIGDVMSGLIDGECGDPGLGEQA
jgi:hypothetical protein